jgi:large subunit ribosomal protein L21
MIAIVEIYGKQYKVSKGDTVIVDSKIDLEIGKTVKFDNIKAVLDKDTNIFNPKELSSYKVSAKVVDHTRADKVLVIKKKRRKGYQRKNGHRQDLTMIQIQSITGTKKKSTSTTKKKATSTTKKKATSTTKKK